MAKTKISYPFVPKSTAYLEPGHFWSIPLDNGRFACGRVLALYYTAGKRNTRLFLAGLLDWWGEKPPSSETIAGRRMVEHGSVHIKTIAENQGEVLGYRPLEDDGIKPGLFACYTTWGYGVIKLLAEKRFGARR
jgi:Immunity protein 26